MLPYNITLSLKKLGTQSFSDYTDIISFEFTKERYTPYTSLNAVIICEAEGDEIIEAKLTLGEKLLHYGIIDTLKRTKTASGTILELTSRGFSSMLAQNELKPGLKVNQSLTSIMQSADSFQNITYEQDTTTISVIYINEHESMWSALTKACIGIYGNYPYIYGTNEVRFTAATPQKTVSPGNSTIAHGNGQDYRNLISRIYMKDLDDSYDSYSYDDGYATQRLITRDKYINLDKQWLSEDNKGLDYRQYFAERGNNYSFIKYYGYNNEDICDKIVFSDSTTLSISRLIIRGSSKGLTTTALCYRDKYCN